MAVYGDDSSKGKAYAHGFLEVINSEFAANFGPGLSICGVSGGVVESCSFHDNQGIGGCWTWAARDVCIQHCISYRNRRGTGNDGFGFDLDGGSAGCTIQYCLSYQNDTAGFAIFDYPDSADTVGNTIRYCISENDVRSDREGGSFAMNSWANTPIRSSTICNCVAFLSSRGGSSICAGFLGIGRQAGEGYQSGDISRCGFFANTIYLEGEGRDLAHLYCQVGASTPQEIAFQGNQYASSKHRLRILSEQGEYSSLSDWQKKTGQEWLSGFKPMVERGITFDPQRFPLGEFHRITDPALMALTMLWSSIPSSSCLRAGSDGKRAFRLDQGGSRLYGAAEDSKE